MTSSEILKIRNDVYLHKEHFLHIQSMFCTIIHSRISSYCELFYICDSVPVSFYDLLIQYYERQVGLCRFRNFTKNTYCFTQLFCWVSKVSRNIICPSHVFDFSKPFLDVFFRKKHQQIKMKQK